MSEESVEHGEAVLDNDMTSLDTEPAVVMDEDRMGADPLEDGMDAPEGYSRDVRLGGTREWEATDPSIDYRLPQEQPDVGAGEEPPGRPVAATPIDDLDESVDDTVGDPADERGGEVELGASSADGAVEATGLPADDAIGEVAAIDREPGTVEEQALRVEQES